MKRIETYIGIVLLLFAIGFNLWIYRVEPTANVDPNDNTFQFALVDRTNQIWDFAQKKCASSPWIVKPCILTYLVDHWVPNWAEGYNLPYYYSHVPQILIVTSWRFFDSIIRLFGYSFISLFSYYHWIIYLFLSLFPLPLFIALRVIGLSWMTAGIGALIATQLSTDGLYGLDPASFLWRGYGLSSQLFAAVWLPLAIAFAFRGRVIPAILTLAATTAGHLGIGIIAFMSVAVVAFKQWKKLPVIFGGVGLLLGYWIVPILQNGNYHNISVWDGIWKFDSFGYREVLKNLFNGDLFDFGRLPILSVLVFIGLFASVNTAFFPFALLFVFWVLMYFGRTTWGSLIDLIPGMNEFHLSRFIVGVHIAGLFLIPIAIEWIVLRITKRFVIRLFAYSLIGLFVYLAVYPQTLRYASYNDFLIARGNENFVRDEADIEVLFSTLKTRLSKLPGRVFAGRGGSWGKNFRVAETPMYMYLSTYGIPVIVWLPETWSPNSDTEQYFSENNPAHYSLYNVRYVATPVTLTPEQIQPFWRLVESGVTWKLYEVGGTSPELAEGYITTGVRPAIVSSTKEDYRSVVRLWMHSDAFDRGLFPELTFEKSYPKQTGLPNFRMIDEVTYKVPDGTTHNLFSEPPLYLSPVSDLGILSNLKITSQSQENDMVFKASVEIPEGCMECIIILKQTFHPSWQATIDGKAVTPFSVFPFYTAISIQTPGTHEVVFSYKPSTTKIILLVISAIALLVIGVYGMLRLA